MAAFKLSELAQQVEADFVGDGDQIIKAVGSIDDATEQQITFLTNSRYRDALEQTKAGAVILRAEDAQGFSGNHILSKNPYLTYARIAQLLDPTPATADKLSEKAHIDTSAKVASSAKIAAFAVVSQGAVIGENCQIGANCFIGENVVLGDGCKLYPNTVLYHNVVLGKQCIIHAGAVIGSDGFGFAPDQGQWIKIPQVGTVILGDDVEIGANVTIDRGAIHNTVIKSGVKIDNLVHIAHNVELGENTALAAGTKIAGSTKVGQRCTFAGNVSVNGHIEIGNDVHFTGTSMVTSSFKQAGVYSSGIPAVENKEWRKNTAKLRRIDTLYDKVKQLEAELKALQQD
ncbi:UDP-3-O-(3-hydroxymyristoyl)glucosamine N-acyltransferase [Catenovulum sp. 2E275]|uniref:UDP-3-O-(3-hydroxymyristoyl)glucosamine N-acyltransferase n=1 Tax=Catenovulum sp. 2E275 TaxID=2980497 RepID=UPI0021CFAA20|nr:UDP-3-O-(3-hydroxymyristoyl)glucosamine N-acyltransferase [Catenovulum sp. 2E275]MCU4675734.1 UDP-3-O-(3-hydroxymyristoyl)glucosamine N-acyltransferase [Catenovulum sp. 2E275]